MSPEEGETWFAKIKNNAPVDPEERELLARSVNTKKEPKEMHEHVEFEEIKQTERPQKRGLTEVADSLPDKEPDNWMHKWEEKEL